MDEGHAEEDSPARVPRGDKSRWSAYRSRGVLKWILRGLAAAAVAGVLFLSLTQTGRYLSRAAWEELKILWRRRSIEKLALDPKVSFATRRKLQIVLDARDYAKRGLGLDVGKSFTTFSELERDTLVLVLSAAHRDRLQYHRWWFPVVGHVPYKGYFDFEMARANERDFQRRGFDTYLRSASAFSTLGWFNDPLVSTTLRADTLSLANTVIHELLHNTFYLPGQTEFNESFANFVGARGSAGFYHARGFPDAVAEAEARWSDDKLLAGFWKRLYNDIDSTFKAHPGDENRHARLALRDSIYRAARENLVFRVGPQLRTVAPRYLERVRLDNAALMARRIYLTDVDLFDAVWVREGRDTRRAIERIIAIAKTDEKRPYDALRQWLSVRPGRVGGVRGSPGTEAAAEQR